MQFAPDVSWRVSKRGLLVCGPGWSPLLVEHPHAAAMPELIAKASTLDGLVASFGGTPEDQQLVDELIAEGLLVDPAAPLKPPAPVERKTFVFTRSGMEFYGIDGVARVAHRLVMPVVLSIPGRILILAVVAGGVYSLLSGRPDGPAVSAHPWADATLGLVLGLGCGALHELAHAVALVHYGRSARSAGVGFYWGALCFYVDSSDGITLPRRARIINALAGLAVDAVTASVLLIVAHVSTPVLIMAVCWRIAIQSLVGLADNGLPILEVDGQVALSDYLDEPDLSPRSREALGRKLRGVDHDEQPPWLAAYGAFSLMGGVVMLLLGGWVWWIVARDMIMALFTGNAAEFLLGLYVSVPFVLGVLFSIVGLFIELFVKDEDATANS